MPSYLYKNLFIGSIFLIFLSLLAHFFIFERYSVGPDDYQTYLMEDQGLRFFLTHPDRPLRYIWAQFQNYIVGYDSFRGLLVTFLFSSITLLSSFLLIRILLKNNLYSFLVTSIYVLLVNKLEIFHYPVMAHVNIPSSLYILSLYFFIRYFEKLSNSDLGFSFFFYSLGLFWYEVGFFIPLIMILYSFIFKREFLFKKQLIFFYSGLLFLILFYLIFRFSGAFGFSDLMSGRSISLVDLPQGFMDVFHIFLGRSFIRSVGYGIYLFFKMGQVTVSLA